MQKKNTMCETSEGMKSVGANCYLNFFFPCDFFHWYINWVYVFARTSGSQAYRHRRFMGFIDRLVTRQIAIQIPSTSLSFYCISFFISFFKISFFISDVGYVENTEPLTSPGGLVSVSNSYHSCDNSRQAFSRFTGHRGILILIVCHFSSLCVYKSCRDWIHYCFIIVFLSPQLCQRKHIDSPIERTKCLF